MSDEILICDNCGKETVKDAIGDMCSCGGYFLHEDDVTEDGVVIGDNGVGEE